MSAVLELALSARIDLEESQQCRFCQCTELNPCGIALAQDPDGTLRLARNDDEVWDVQACAWYIEGVCSAPSCVEQLIAERRGEATPRVFLFDGQGRAIPLGDRSLDLAADDRDFRLIGRELGLLGDISRELILDRIRELRRNAGERIA
jgi:hypothetical protein